MISADLMRIISIFLVVMLHVSGVLWVSLDVTSLDWSLINIYNSLSRCSVQIFIMLSGVFLLSPQKNISDKSIYTKYLPRIIISLIFWSAIYLISTPFNIESVKYIIVSILKGSTNYHLWFLYMLIGLYVMTPILRIITKNATKKQIEYFLAIGIIISIIVPNLSEYSPLSFISTNIDKMYLFMPRSYLIFYLLGFYFTNFEMNRTTKKIIYCLGVLGALFTIFITQYLSNRNLAPTDSWQGVFSLNTLLYSSAVFIFLKNWLDKLKFSSRSLNIISLLSACSFGVFLTHDLFIKYLIRHNILTTNLINPILTVPLITLGIFILSNILSYIIKKIPILNKYII
ncbi:acyltransferase [Clostridium sp.]|uniref:acyltransferase n=1 Tax=Clostridium sp. TaxID=1506 RepID=UPI00345C67A6